MKKRLLAVLLILVLSLCLAACDEDPVDAERQAFIDSFSEEEMVIAVWERDYQQYVAEVETKAAYDLMNFEGAAIRYLTIPAENYEEYYEKINELLYQNESIDLIHLPFGTPYQSYVDNGVAMDLTEAVPEIQRIYPMLQNPYFVPATIWVFPTVLDRIKVESLGFENMESLDRDGYMKIREAYLTKTPRYFTKRRYQEEIADFHTRFKVFDLENCKVSLAKPEVVDYVDGLRNEIFSDRYLGIQEQSADDFVVPEAANINGLNTQQLGWRVGLDMADLIFLPPVFEPDQALLTDGYIVNRFGRNKDLAVRFLRKYLDDEYQIAIYEESYSFYPVSQEVTDDIYKLEKFVLRTESLKELQLLVLANMEAGVYESPSNKPYEYWLMMTELYQRLEELVYDEDYYTREDLKAELKALEERLYLIMIE